MSRMLRVYQPQNVIGDFTKNNEFYADDDFSFLDGKLQIVPQGGRALFARMVIHNGRNFFEIKQSDGQWLSYPVDYTIGSKWQQAYATRLPNGQIHVFPIQYNRIEKKWVNYWKVIDEPGSERANPYNWEKLDASTNYMVNCAVCHTSQLHNTRSNGFDQDDLAFRESGVDCEMCHGPSADHVQAMSTGNYVEKESRLIRRWTLAVSATANSLRSAASAICNQPSTKAAPEGSLITHRKDPSSSEAWNCRLRNSVAEPFIRMEGLSKPRLLWRRWNARNAFAKGRRVAGHVTILITPMKLPIPPRLSSKIILI